MRFDLRLHGVTEDGTKCQADISVYAQTADDLQREAEKAGTTAAWRSVGPNEDWIPEGSKILVDGVEQLNARKERRNKRP